MGGGIATMHYVGMHAMRLPAMCAYSHGVVVLSVFLGVIISFVAHSSDLRYAGADIPVELAEIRQCAC